MFTLSKLKPAQGWNAVAWELAIVTLGVLLALSAQEWAENRSMQRKVEATKRALRDELGEHYGYAVEYRTVYPCIQAQVRRLLDHVLSSGPIMDPVPIYREQNFSFVLRFPSKFLPADAWNAAVNNGLIERFEPTFRRQLAGHYIQTEYMRSLSTENDEAEKGFAALAHRLPLEPAVRYAIVKEIEQLSGRLDTLDLNYGQEIDDIQKVGMLPDAEFAQALTERYGTYQFCKAQGLPIRSYKEAMEAVQN